MFSSGETIGHDRCPAQEMDDGGVLNQISPYATLRAEDLKQILDSSTDLEVFHRKISRLSLQDVFKGRIEDDADDYETSAITDREGRGSSRTVCCGDLNESPVQYEVAGIRNHEMPVIGLYVDKNICPGFRYKVRYNEGHEELFEGKAKTLLTIGMGYGKRLTFQGDRLNNNDNYFWSDSHIQGFAFSLEVVSVGDEFVIYNSLSEPVGKLAAVSLVGHQKETNQETRVGSVAKTVRVMMTCSIVYYQRYQLLDLHSKDLETIEGEAVVVKEKRSRKARIECIQNVHISRLGLCTLRLD